MSWQPGEVIVRRQVWRGLPWAALPLVVVRDEPELLAGFLPDNAPLGFVPDFPLGRHPWAGQERWRGHGTLMLHRPGDPYSVWVFWRGEERAFSCWYVNFEEPFRRTAIGIDTLDHELDLLCRDGRTWIWKDEEMLDRRVAEGRFDAAVAASVRATAQRFEADVAADGTWWDAAWADWRPAAIPDISLPEGWERVRAA